MEMIAPWRQFRIGPGREREMIAEGKFQWDDAETDEGPFFESDRETQPHDPLASKNDFTSLFGAMVVKDVRSKPSYTNCWLTYPSDVKVLSKYRTGAASVTIGLTDDGQTEYSVIPSEYSLPDDMNALISDVIRDIRATYRIRGGRLDRDSVMGTARSILTNRYDDVRKAYGEDKDVDSLINDVCSASYRHSVGAGIFEVLLSDPHIEDVSLDALDAYNRKLVKKIKVKGVEIKHDTGDRYIYLESVVPAKSGPQARMEIIVGHSSGLKKETRLFRENDNLHQASNGLEFYKGIYIVSIDGHSNSVSFSDGSVIYSGQCIGEKGKDEAKRRIQIRETIISHLVQEEKLFKKGIKALSLFFIDDVSNYRVYDDAGNASLGLYGRIFEEEYNRIISERREMFDPDYIRQLTSVDVSEIHKGYFSIDKGRMVNSKVTKGYEGSSDPDAYNLILRNKELLLSYDSPVRFIFSHSALSEGWDNPNVFQICALKHSDSTTRRRQEVGRGMRICVNQKGERQDVEALGPLFHDINSLTVIADESYEAFVKGLQSEELQDIRARPVPLDETTLTGQHIVFEAGEMNLDSGQAKALYKYLVRNDYVDEDTDLPTQSLKDAITFKSLAELPEALRPFKTGIEGLLGRLAEPRTIASTVKDARRPVLKSNDLNERFRQKEFVELWNRINHKYHYKVSFDSEELIRHSVKSIEDHLVVSKISYVVTAGEQKSEATYSDAINKDKFERASTRSGTMDVAPTGGIRYDLIGRVAEKTGLTRKTIASILVSLQQKTLDLFKANPEEFIEKVSSLINDEKSTVIVEHIEYDMTDGTYDSDIFTMERPEGDYDTAYQARKNVQDYIFPQSGVELAFAKALDDSDEVAVYAKLPDGRNGFSIPTPLDNYAPDWAIAFKEGSVRHIYFVAETKGSMRSLDLRAIEKARIRCAEKLFEKLHGDVVFHQVADYDDLWSLVNKERGPWRTSTT